MSSEPTPPTQETVQNLCTKLQAFIDTLSADEQRALATVLLQAAEKEGEEVAGYAEFGGAGTLAFEGLNRRGIIVVGGRSSAASVAARSGIIIVGGKGR